MSMAIEVVYRAIDGARIARKFKTLDGASAFAVKMVGATPDMGTGYAVSADGIGKIMLMAGGEQAIVLADLFPALKTKGPAEGPFEVWSYVVNEDQGTSTPIKDGAFATLAEACEFIEKEGPNMEGARIQPIGEEATAEYEAFMWKLVGEQEQAEREYESRWWDEFYAANGVSH